MRAHSCLARWLVRAAVAALSVALPLALPVAPRGLGAQYQRSAQPSRAVPVRVALTIAGQPTESRGDGVCYHRPNFAVHGLAAQQWSVRYASTAGADPIAVLLSLTIPKGAATGPFAATLTTHRTLRRIGVGTPRPQGSGTVTPSASGTGWRFTFDARTADGAVVKGTVTCERISPLG